MTNQLLKTILTISQLISKNSALDRSVCSEIPSGAYCSLRYCCKLDDYDCDYDEILNEESWYWTECTDECRKLLCCPRPNCDCNDPTCAERFPQCDCSEGCYHNDFTCGQNKTTTTTHHPPSTTQFVHVAKQLVTTKAVCDGCCSNAKWETSHCNQTSYGKSCHQILCCDEADVKLTELACPACGGAEMIRAVCRQNSAPNLKVVTRCNNAVKSQINRCVENNYFARRSIGNILMTLKRTATLDWEAIPSSRTFSSQNPKQYNRTLLELLAGEMPNFTYYYYKHVCPANARMDTCLRQLKAAAWPCQELDDQEALIENAKSNNSVTYPAMCTNQCLIDGRDYAICAQLPEYDGEYCKKTTDSGYKNCLHILKHEMKNDIKSFGYNRPGKTSSLKIVVCAYYSKFKECIISIVRTNRIKCPQEVAEALQKFETETHNGTTLVLSRNKRQIWEMYNETSIILPPLRIYCDVTATASPRKTINTPGDGIAQILTSTQSNDGYIIKYNKEASILLIAGCMLHIRYFH